MRTFPILLFLISAGTATANALDTSLLETQVRNITKGNIGVGVQVVETGEQWFFKGDERFPMQSTYKAPIAVAVLHQADQGVLAGTSGDLLGVWPATNDVGILTTPQGKHIAIAVFISNSPASLEDIEKATAQIAAAAVKAFAEQKKTSLQSQP